MLSQMLFNTFIHDLEENIKPLLVTFARACGPVKDEGNW